MTNNPTSSRGQATAALLKELMLDDDDDDDTDSARSAPESPTVRTAPPPPRDSNAIRVGQRTSVGRSSPPASPTGAVAATSLSPVPDGLQTPPRAATGTRVFEARSSDDDDAGEEETTRANDHAASGSRTRRSTTAAAADAASRMERHRRVQQLCISSSDDDDDVGGGRKAASATTHTHRMAAASGAGAAPHDTTSAAATGRHREESELHRSSVAAKETPPPPQSNAPTASLPTTNTAASSALVVPPQLARPLGKTRPDARHAAAVATSVPAGAAVPTHEKVASTKRNGVDAGVASGSAAAAIVVATPPPSYMSSTQLAATVALRDDALIDQIELTNRAYRAAAEYGADKGRSASIPEPRAAAPPAPTAASSSRGRSADDESPMFEVVEDEDGTEAAEYVTDHQHLSTTPARSAESSSLHFQLDTQSTVNQQSGGGGPVKSSGARERSSPAVHRGGSRHVDGAAGGSSSSVDFYDIDEEEPAAATQAGGSSLGPRERSPLFYGGVRPAHDTSVPLREGPPRSTSRTTTIKDSRGRNATSRTTAATTAASTTMKTAPKKSQPTATAGEQQLQQKKSSAASTAPPPSFQGVAAAATNTKPLPSARVIRSRSVEDDTSQGTYTRLYVQAMNRRAYVMESREAERQRLEALAMRDCTFAPAISAAAQKFGESQRTRSAGSHSAAAVERRSRRLQEERSIALLEAEKSQCTFAPSLEPVSVAIVERIRERLADDVAACASRDTSPKASSREVHPRNNIHDGGDADAPRQSARPSPHREAPLLLLPASERLYRDSRRRAIELEQQVEMQLQDLQRPAPKRTEAQMLEHITQLQSFQEKREATIQRLLELEAIRTKPLRDVLLVDPDAVVGRLFHRPTPDGEGAGGANVSASGSSITTNASAAGGTRNTPRVPRVSHELAARKKQRALERWFHTLASRSSGSETMTPAVLPTPGSPREENACDDTTKATMDLSDRGLRAAILSSSPALQHSDAFQAITKAAADYVLHDSSLCEGRAAARETSVRVGFPLFAAVLLRYEQKTGPQAYTSKTPEECLRDAALKSKSTGRLRREHAVISTDAERVSSRLYATMTSSTEQKRRQRGTDGALFDDAAPNRLLMGAAPSLSPPRRKPTTDGLEPCRRASGSLVPSSSTEEVVSDLLDAIASLHGSRDLVGGDGSFKPVTSAAVTPPRPTSACSGVAQWYVGDSGAGTNETNHEEASEVLMSPLPPPVATNQSVSLSGEVGPLSLLSTLAPLEVGAVARSQSSSSSPKAVTSSAVLSRRTTSEVSDDLLLQCAAGQRLSNLAIASREKRAAHEKQQAMQLRNLGKQMATAQLQARRSGLLTS